MARPLHILVLLFCLFLVVAPAQVQTPFITSPQSTTSVTGPADHGNAITSGLSLDSFYLLINGNFDPRLFDNVRWFNPSTNQTFICQFDSNCFVQTGTNLIRLGVPGSLFSTPVSSQVAVQITVTERFDA